MDEVYIHRYSLRARSLLNAVAGRREFSGVLIRVGEGYGCIHPWPELGDPTLEKCLKDLVGARRHSLVRRALRCAELDGAARENGDWMFADDAIVPDSHATLPEMTHEAVEKALVAGFGTVKFKVGRDGVKEAVKINELVQHFPQLRLRLDANEAFSVEAFREFAEALTDASRNAIDFIEDPVPYDGASWESLRRETRLRFALDRELQLGAAGVDAYIIKPATEEPWLYVEDAVAQGRAAVLTSYMDHPLGQSFAAWEAVRMNAAFPGAVSLCGLQTHGLFRQDAFTYELGEVQPEFSPAAGTGLGFDDLLAGLDWELLDPFSF